MIEQILNEQLNEGNIPAENVDWNIISKFAITFDGYHYTGSFRKCASLSRKTYEDYTKNQETLNENSIDDLRCALFFMQRAMRWRMPDGMPSEGEMRYMKDIISAIKRKIKK